MTKTIRNMGEEFAATLIESGRYNGTAAEDGAYLIRQDLDTVDALTDLLTAGGAPVADDYWGAVTEFLTTEYRQRYGDRTPREIYKDRENADFEAVCLNRDDDLPDGSEHPYDEKGFTPDDDVDFEPIPDDAFKLPEYHADFWAPVDEFFKAESHAPRPDVRDIPPSVLQKKLDRAYANNERLYKEITEREKWELHYKAHARFWRSQATFWQRLATERKGRAETAESRLDESIEREQTLHDRTN